MKTLGSEVAIITASAGAGIGQAIARRLAEEGAKVVVSDGNEKRTAEVAAALKKEGHNAIGVACNVTDHKQVDGLVRRTLEEFGRIDILVNNAGINKTSLLHETSDETWDLVMNVNLKGTFYCCRAVLPSMLKQKHGRIVNVSSIYALMGSPSEVPYTSAKCAIIGFTRSLAKEVAKQGITVNCIMPGFTPNPFLNRIYPEEELKAIEARIPMGGVNDPVDLANAVRFLVSTESRRITGCAMAVAGGEFFY